MIEDSFNSVVRVQKTERTNVDGSLSTAWVTVPGLAAVDCRLDVNFVRPGKQAPPPQEAGRSPDREGTAFFGIGGTSPGHLIKPMYRILSIRNRQGIIPVPGTFEIRAWPDAAQDMDGPQHYEVAIYEVSAMVAAL